VLPRSPLHVSARGNSGGKGCIWEVIVSVIVRKKFTRTCVLFWMFTESTKTKTLWTTTKKDKLLTVHFKCLNLNLTFNVNFFTKKWQICYSWKSMFENSTSNLNAISHVWEDRVLFVWVDLHILYTDCSIQIESEQFVSSLHFYLVNLAFHSFSQTKI
jgi:hypothetical protein